MAEEDPLSWLLELDAKLDGAKEMLEVLRGNQDVLGDVDKALKKTEQQTKRTGDGHEGHAKHARTLTHEIQELGDKLTNLTAFEVFEFGFEHAIELAHELAEKIAEVGKEIVNAAAHEERFTKSFKLQLGDDAGEVLEYFDKLGSATEFIDDETKKMGLDLTKAGFAAKDLPYAMAAIADLAGMSSDRLGGASAAMEALAKIQRSGKVMERSLAPFGIGEDKLIDVIQRRGNKSGPEAIKKALQAGSLDREEVLQSVYQAITEKTGKALGGVGEDMGQILESRLRRLKNLPEQYFEQWSRSPSFVTFSDRMGAVFERLNPDSPDGKRIFAALEGVINSVVDWIDRLLTPAGIDAFVAGLERGFEMVKGLIHWLDELTTGLEDAGPKIRETFENVATIVDAIAKSVNVVVKGLELIGKLNPNKFMDEARKSMPEGDPLARALGWGAKKKQAGGLAPELGSAKLDIEGLDSKGAREGARKAGRELGSAHEMGVREELDMHSPSRRLMNLGRLAADSFALGVGAASEDVGDAFDFDTSGLGASSGSSSGASAGTRPISLSVPISVTVEAGADRDDAEAIARRIEEIVPTAIQTAIEQLRAELGA